MPGVRDAKTFGRENCCGECADGCFRLPLRQREDIEQTAARNRAERLFAVNFRSTWTR